LRQLLEQVELRERFAKAARDCVVSRFDERQAVRKHVALYRRLLGIKAGK